MPTYEYACSLCGHQLEIFQSIRAERLVTCPACSKEGLRRLIGTGAGIIFKGTGFYQTDYKKAAPSSGESAKEGGEKPAAPVSGDTSAKKPAAAASAPAGKSTSSTST